MHGIEHIFHACFKAVATELMLCTFLTPLQHTSLYLYRIGDALLEACAAGLSGYSSSQLSMGSTTNSRRCDSNFL